jgi:hypothetical protein
MPSQAETDFNCSVASILIPEYERETGNALRLIACDKEFPDLILERVSDGTHLDVELVEVILAFVNQEQGELRRYEQSLVEVVSRLRPKFRNKKISLQISETAFSGTRPHAFPNIKSKEATSLISEFQELLAHSGEEILASWGGLLRVFGSKPGSPAMPTLMRHFDAIMINDIPETYPGRIHPDDPVIDLCSTTLYNSGEIAAAVQRAIEAKHKKGPSYTADMLILHTVKADHKPYGMGIGLHAENIVEAGKIFAPVLRERFGEIWFLNAYFNGDGKRLYRLA